MSDEVLEGATGRGEGSSFASPRSLHIKEPLVSAQDRVRIGGRILIPIRVFIGLTARALCLFALRIRDTALDLESNAIGAGHTETCGVASNLQNMMVNIAVGGEVENQLGRSGLL